MLRFLPHLLALDSAVSTAVQLSNVALPVDQNGEKLITGEADIVEHEGAWYLYFNNWGTCPGVDCCKSAAGCASCCFDHPPTPFKKGCEKGARNSSDPYGDYHTVQAYKTTDFKTFINLGVALPLTKRLPGCEFRPHVLYNKKTQLFVMWFEDRPDPSQPGSVPLHGYSIATSPTPGGPFTAKYYNVTLPGHGRTGDYDLFIDDDGTAYNVRTGFDVVKLNDEYTGPADSTAMSSFKVQYSLCSPVCTVCFSDVWGPRMSLSDRCCVFIDAQRQRRPGHVQARRHLLRPGGDGLLRLHRRLHDLRHDGQEPRGALDLRRGRGQ